MSSPDDQDPDQNHLDPIVKALPPATDYLTYLTILEYNLNAAKLPLLHPLLQDHALTANIGWDLLHLLLPLLPASVQCLEDVARLGNPREVILKVTQCLGEINNEYLDEDTDTENARTTSDSAPTGTPAGRERTSGLASGDPEVKHQNFDHGEDSMASLALVSVEDDQQPSSLPLRVREFICLLSMLSVLHRRLKTKYPSRFLATSLEAVLGAYRRNVTAETTEAVLEFIWRVSSPTRPRLPPRDPRPGLSEIKSMFFSLQGLKLDPEAETRIEPSPSEDSAVVVRLLQSALIEMLEVYILSLENEDYPGLAWTVRLQERTTPQMNIPGRKLQRERFAEEQTLKERDVTVEQIMSTARDLKVDAEWLLRSCLKRGEFQPRESDSLPEFASDVAVSPNGCLFLLTAWHLNEDASISASLASSTRASETSSKLALFPHHADILTTFLGTTNISDIGSEPESVVDAVLSLGFLIIAPSNSKAANGIPNPSSKNLQDISGKPQDDEHFGAYIQVLSMLSLKCPYPILRHYALVLASQVLSTHPSLEVRFSVIRDALSDCPFPLIKASAVGWLKEQILAGIKNEKIATVPESPNPFLDTLNLAQLWPALFPPSIPPRESKSSLLDRWTAFKPELPFYLATCNFYYFIQLSKQLRQRLPVSTLAKDHRTDQTCISPLQQATAEFQSALTHPVDEGIEIIDAEGEEGVARGLSELALLDDVLNRIIEVHEAQNEASSSKVGTYTTAEGEPRGGEGESAG